MSLLKRYWPYLTLALAPLLALWPAVFLGKVIGPFDQIQAMAPWNKPAPSAPWDVLQADGVLQFYSWRDQVLSAWGSGKVPFWNPYELAGTPLLANSQSAALYPPHILLGLLHVPTALAMVLLAWFHLAWAGLGTYFLARKIGASRTGGTVAGVSFSLSAFMVAWTGLPSVITTVAWIPWILGLTIALFQIEPTPRHRTIRRAFLLALSFGMLILAGHLQFVAYGGMAVAISAIWMIGSAIANKQNPLRRALLFVGALAIGAAIAAPQLLPVLNYSQFSHRRNTPSEGGYEAYQASAIQPFELVGVVHSNLTGSPSEPVPAIKEPVTSYWPAFVKRGGNFAESAIGLGPLVIGLLLLARRRLDWRKIGGVGMVGVVAFLLATGTAAGRLLYFYVPGWSSTGSPGRISVLFVLAMCVLAGVSMTLEKEPEPKEKWQLYAPVAGLALISLASIYALMFAVGELHPLLPGMSVDTLQTIISSSTGGPKALAAVSTLVAAVAIAFWLKNARKPNWVLVAAALICFPLSVPSVLRFSDNADLKMDGPTQERVAFINDGWDLLGRANAIAPPNVSSLSHIHELGGYDSLMHRDTVAMLADVNGKDPAPPANGNMMFIKPGADPVKLGEAGVTQMIRLTPQGVERTPIESKGRAYTEKGPAIITGEDSESITLKATGPGTLTLKDRNMPGWTATVDRTDAPIKDGLWRVIDLPAGEHEIVFAYSPPGWILGLQLGFVGWLLLILGLGYSALTGRRASRPAIVPGTDLRSEP